MGSHLPAGAIYLAGRDVVAVAGVVSGRQQEIPPAVFPPHDALDSSVSFPFSFAAHNRLFASFRTLFSPRVSCFSVAFDTALEYAVGKEKAKEEQRMRKRDLGTLAAGMALVPH